MRADAAANRTKVLDVAEDVFGRGGQSASTEEIARLAGVGIGTVFRHFPTKAALIQAVLVRRFEQLTLRARELAHARDPGEAFFGFFTHMVEDAAGKIAIAEALVTAGGDPGDATRAAAELREAFGELLRRAQAAGAVRHDVALPEAYALVVGLSRAGLAPDVRSKTLRVVFDGLRPRG